MTKWARDNEPDALFIGMTHDEYACSIGSIRVWIGCDTSLIRIHPAPRFARCNGKQLSTAFSGMDVRTNSNAYVHAIKTMKRAWSCKEPVSYGARVEYRMTLGAAREAIGQANQLTRRYVESMPFAYIPTRLANKFKLAQL